MEGTDLFRLNSPSAREHIAVLLAFVLLLVSLTPAVGAAEYSPQVGAFGDASSVNSMGFQVETRTHIYHVNSPDRDFFEVGAFLMNSGYIQFGYALLPAGNYCKTGKVNPGIPFSCSDGSETVNDSQPVWYWEYSPNATGGLYFGLGSLGTLQTNGTWHLYTILPDPNRGWAFEIDGQEVASAHFPLSDSRDRVFVVAAKTTTSSTLAPLGPVEFRNLSYLKPDGWHTASALYALVTCGLNTQCPSNPYGVSLIGPDHIIAGTSATQQADGKLLWMNPSPATPFDMTKILTAFEGLMTYLLLGVTVLAAIFVAGFVVRPMRKRIKKESLLAWASN